MSLVFAAGDEVERRIQMATPDLLGTVAPALAAENIPVPVPIDLNEVSDMAGEVTRQTGNPKDAIGDTKPDLSLIPPAFNLLVSQAMMDGAKKYGPYNWRDNPVRARVYIAAALRHMSQYLDGEDIDPTSGVYHLGHAGACLAILADALTVGNLIDDRPKVGQAGDLIRRFGETKSFKK